MIEGGEGCDCKESRSKVRDKTDASPGEVRVIIRSDGIRINSRGIHDEDIERSRT